MLDVDVEPLYFAERHVSNESLGGDVVLSNMQLYDIILVFLLKSHPVSLKLMWAGAASAGKHF